MATRNEMNRNTFGETLGSLFSSTKSKLSKKDWSDLLGVSESAISQWTTGKTFPDSDKLRTIIAVYEKYDLNDNERDKLNELMSVIEFRLGDLWDKVPSKYKYHNVSDYILNELEVDVKNSISMLFYDLKSELYNQFLRQIDILKEDLTCRLIEEEKPAENFHDKILRLKHLQNKFQDKSNSRIFLNYTKHIRSIHTTINKCFKSVLDECDLTVEDHTPRLRFKWYTPLPKFQPSSMPEDARNYPNVPYITFPTKTEVYLQNMTAYNAFNEERGGLRFMNFTQNAVNPVLDFKEIFSSVHKVINHVKINNYHRNVCEIAFTDPEKNKDELLNVKFIKLSPKELDKEYIKEQRLLFAFNYISAINNRKKIGHSAVLTEKNFNQKIQAFLSDTGESSYILILDYPSLGKTTGEPANSDIAKNLESIFDQSHEFRKRKEQNNCYLIKPEQTRKRYSVEILNLDENEKLIKSTIGDEIVILLVGNINIKEKNENSHGWDSIQNLNTTTEFSCFHKLKSNNDYRIQNYEENSVALLIREYNNP